MNKELISGIPNGYSSKIIDLFKAMSPGSQIILFGSRAKGNFREGSDIDIAIKGSQANGSHRDDLMLKYFDLNFPWRLDLIIYESISEPTLREHIDRVGKLLLKID